MSDPSMAHENLEDLCKDCGPAFTAFLEQMAEHNKEQMNERSAKISCPTCGKVHEYTFPFAPKTAIQPAS